MRTYLYLATGHGLAIAEWRDGMWQLARRALPGRVVTSVTACEGLILAGTTEGIFRSDDNGATWREAEQDLTIRHIRWLSRPDPCLAFVLAGTEPAGIFISRNGGERWIPCPEVEELRDAHVWQLPYSPEAGCVRGFAVHGADPYSARVYAAVEVGGVLVSADSGETWQLVVGSDGNPDLHRTYRSMVHPDVHSISVHPSSRDLVTASTGGGLYRSADAGANWRLVYECYCRAAWVDPEDPQHIVFGPADSVSKNGRIVETRDGGAHWRSASKGMATPWPDHMVERFTQDDGSLLAVLSNGELWSASLDDLQWQRILPDIPDVRCAAVYQ
ncbi:MAG: WD40/YVTN/BNR-like repeat-containing protein [Anaerolineae bacterium]|jgi:photosystem II stability/assembly factor-like uncharacterized protein